MSDLLKLGTTALTCKLCGAPALVQWRRRPTPTELTAMATRIPASTAADTTVTVYACGPHAISMTAAAQIHQATCTAPDQAHLPNCSCTPEPLPAARPAFAAGRTVTLATGWTVPAPASS
ncbi:hypothetical protein [Streptomyces sp. NRRL S-350]|uniref:hypothetical protein n=1 Tax=Streptomyces sp. NRRL S-350 TaxID=1463902 RepID=UPI00099BF678|nr:hypothetical protein [Streptomyces sp. NRRL S-350]